MADIPTDIYLRAKDELEQFYDGPIPNRAAAIAARARQLMQPDYVTWRKCALEACARYRRALDGNASRYARMEHLDCRRQYIERYLATKPRASLAQAAE